MTLEVNAAIAGAVEAGATEVLVADSHGDGQNIDMELLDKRARLIRAWPRPLGMMQGIDATFGAVVFIGYHGGEGAAEAVLAHTDTGNSSRASWSTVSGDPWRRPARFAFLSISASDNSEVDSHKGVNQDWNSSPHLINVRVRASPAAVSLP